MGAVVGDRHAIAPLSFELGCWRCDLMVPVELQRWTIKV